MPAVRSLDDLLVEELRRALTVEQELVPLLAALVPEVEDVQLEKGLRRHRDETIEHAANVESALRILGAEPVGAASFALAGLGRESEAMLAALDPQAAPELRDLAVIAAAGAVEAHEIALYESALGKVRMLGADDVADLLGRNLESERAMLDEGLQIAARLAREIAHVPAAVVG